MFLKWNFVQDTTVVLLLINSINWEVIIVSIGHNCHNNYELFIPLQST